MGRFGLFGPDSFAITPSSVERCQFRIGPDVPLQRPVEGPARECALEAGEAGAGIRTATRLAPPGHEATVLRHEPQELALRRLPPTADAAPDGVGHAAGASSPLGRSWAGSTGMPAGTSSGGATAGCSTSRST